MPLEPADLKKFEANVRKVVPGVTRLDLSESQWQDLGERLEKTKPLTFSRVVLALAKVTSQHHNHVIQQVSSKQPSRACKKEPAPEKTYTSKKRKIDKILNPEDNQFVMEKKN